MPLNKEILDVKLEHLTKHQIERLQNDAPAVKYLDQAVFIIETAAHLRGYEHLLLPIARQLRNLLPPKGVRRAQNTDL